MNCSICGTLIAATNSFCPACGAPLPVPTLPTGTLLQGKYRITELLGQGGFGITYSAMQEHIGLKVAIKELFPDGAFRHGNTIYPPHSLGATAWQQTKQAFTEEARVLARFNHPDIVRVLDLFEENGTAYMVMERLEGESLLITLSRQGSLPAPVVEAIARRISQALEMIHAAGLLHRDLKPDNLIVEHTGRLVLIDFGSARSFVSGQTVQHTQLVTPGYAPLEQYSSAAKFGPYTDIYALGATLYHALTGTPPPTATDRVMGTALPPLPNMTPPGLRQAIEQALAIPITQRPATAQAFSQLLSHPLPTQHRPQPVPMPQMPMPTRADLGFLSLEPYPLYALQPGLILLPDPKLISIEPLIGKLSEVISIEGPLTVQRAYQVYCQCAARKLTRENKSRLNKALTQAVRTGKLVLEDEWGTPGYIDKIVRLPGTPPVRVRQLSIRKIREVPPSEVAELMRMLIQSFPNVTADDQTNLYRLVLLNYGMQRITTNAQAVLDRAYALFQLIP